MRRHFTELRRLPTFLKSLLSSVKSLLILLKCLLFVENCLVEWKTCRTFAQTMKRALTYSLSCVCALVLLMGCARDGAQMREQLSALEQRNSSGEPMENDSLAEALADYFDRHGSANERMRAKYILGRTYYCLGELPRALETYMEAADCADTTAADCDFAKLSRIHAQSAQIFDEQIQPRSELRELKLAEIYAKRGKDTLMAIECYAQQANAYRNMQNDDSIIIIKENAAKQYRDVNEERLAAQTLGSTILSHINKNEIEKAGKCIWEYETFSGNFDEDGNITIGREVYYYVKGLYYIEVNELDSAEYMFRKELRDGKDLNNQIAGCLGLQKVYEKRIDKDSIAKYAKMSYLLNDSAYSLAEMQNIQKMQASYNYNHNKQIAEQKKLQAQKAWMLLIIVVLGVAIMLMFFSKHYLHLRKVAVDYRIKNANISRRLRKMATANPPILPNHKDWKELRKIVESEIPSFSSKLNSDSHLLTDFEYDICLLIRVNISPRDISRLKNCSPSQITKVRKGLLAKVFNREGSAEEFDDEIGKIG